MGSNPTLTALRQAQGLGHTGYMWVVYILLCDQKTFYVGRTDNVTRRLNEHKGKYSLYTKKFSDIQLVYTEEHSNSVLAKKREKQLKGWSVAKKKALIAGDKQALIALSKSPELVEEGGKQW